MSYLSFMKEDELWNRLVAKPPKMRLLVMLNVHILHIQRNVCKRTSRQDCHYQK